MDNDTRKLIWDRAKKYYPVKASHGLNHIEDNLNMAEKMLAFAKEPFTDQIYAAIVFHDSGLEKYGREAHEVHSAEIAKRELKDLFNSKDLFLIAAAIREHRASFKGAFTSMLSDICSSADRNAPNFEASVARSFLYTSEHHPEFSFEEKCETVATHLKKKYGSNGYARFPIYYSRYYGKDLANYKRKMDGLNAIVVEGIVGKDGKNASKIYDASMEGYSETASEISGVYNRWIGEYMYHGSSSKFTTLEPQIRNNRTTSTTKPKIFFTPFKGFAGIFCIDQNDQLLSVFGSDYNKESIVVLPKEMPVKDKDGNYDLSQFQQVDTNIAFKHNVKEFKSKFTKRFVGYIHFVKTDKLISSGLQEHIFHGIPEYWYYKSVQVDKVERVEITATFEYDPQLSNKVGVAALESLLTEDINAKVEQNIVESKMYFANNNGKIPKDVNGNIVLTKNVTDATIYAAFDQFNDSKVAMACKGFMQYKNGTNKHVLVVHGDDSLTEPEEMDCVGTIYSVTLSEPIEFRYHGHRGFGKCQLPKIYTVKEEALKDAQIKKEESVKFKATFEYEKSLTMQHTIENLDVSATFLQEFNAGIEEFNRWVRDLELKYLRDELNDEQVTMAFEQIAQESILTDTVKTIFRKIGEFIAWFFRKLKDLWNYFFGKTQRGMRALKSANDLITRHKNSNGFFNDAAFEAAKAPQGLVTAVGLDQFLTTGFSPDVFSSIFNEMLDMWASRPEELYEEVFVKFNQAPTSHKWHYLLAYLPTKPGPDGMDGMKYAKTKHPATGTMRESAYDRESVFILLKEAMDAYVAYEKNSSLIATRGNTTVDAARRMIEYQDRTDITEREAVQLAKDIQELGSWMQVVFKSYQSGFEFILQQMNMVTSVYTKYMK